MNKFVTFQRVLESFELFEAFENFLKSSDNFRLLNLVKSFSYPIIIFLRLSGANTIFKICS